MAQHLRMARLYLVLLGIFTVGRWLHGSFGVPYEKGHHVFSIVTLTLFSAIFYGAFTRCWRSYRLVQAMGLALLFGIAGQLVIILATVVSYALGLHTYFNDPRVVADASSLGPALMIRLAVLVANSITASIAGALGWAMGALLPQGN